MKRNTHAEFVGLEALKAKQAWQLGLFENWAATARWDAIHSAHYDWWMFPIDAPSSYGYAWTVYEGDVAELLSDADFMTGYLGGAELLALAWGWDLGARAAIPDPHRDQRWQDWPIRLHKCARSLQLFGQESQFESLRGYALLLLWEGVDMTYRGKDLSLLFRRWG